MMNKFYAWLAATDGMTGIEYGMIAALVSSAAAVGAWTMGDEISNLLNSIRNVDLGGGPGLSE